MKTLKCVEKIAKATREWAEAKSNTNLMFSEDLSCMCVIASTKLHNHLTRSGIKATLCEALEYPDEECSPGHVFVVVDKHIVDITATQFDKHPKVVIRKVVKNERQWYWNHQKSFKTVTGLRTYLERAGWPREQIMLTSR